MNSRDMFDLFNSMNKKDLKALVVMGVEYLVNQHGDNFKDIVKDIKVLHKRLKML